MPYISRTKRNTLDKSISQLILDLRRLEWDAGDINYSISRIVGAAFEDKQKYRTIAMITGVLSNVATEFERRIVGPYEDNSIEHNGDVREYARMSGLMDRSVSAVALWWRGLMRWLVRTERRGDIWKRK